MKYGIHTVVISIENLYWVLYANLLDPIGLDCHYYYPFGTKQRLSNGGEFHPIRPQQEHNVLFHYDQEPIWSDDFGIYDNYRVAWSTKIVRILANSEHSELKKKVCRDRKLLDWYFFYHGFAALDWYHDAQYIHQQWPIKTALLCLNHVFDKRSYRVALLARLIDAGVTQNASISFHVTPERLQAELNDPGTELSEQSKKILHKHQDTLVTLPWVLDNVPINGALSARFGHQEYRMWQSSLWHLVTETVFLEPKLHLTEKVFKPIVAKRPFILAAAPGNLAYLRGYGFQTFDRWIDEGYDDIQCPDQRLDAIVQELTRFSTLNKNELMRVQQEMLPVLEHNKAHFFGAFRKIIVDEMIDNFDTCIRIWNNGRVDGRQRPLHPDLASVKRLLLE
jgi:hypothetical protein